MTPGRGRRFAATAAVAIAMAPAEALARAEDAGNAPQEAGGTGNGGQTVARSPATPPATPLFRPEEELLLEVRTDQYIVSDALSGYASPRGVYLPLGEFTRLLDLAIVADAEAGRAEGWFLSPTRTFRLDIEAGVVETPRGRTLLAPGDAVAADGDVYVRAPLLAAWFPLEVEASLAKQQVRLKLLETFPFEARIARASSRAGLGARGGGDRTRYAREATPYALATFPALDVNLRGAIGTTQDASAEYDLRASADLLFMNADLFVGGEDGDPLSSARVTLRRRDPDGTLLGPLGLTLVELGDTALGAQPLGPRSSTGRGFVFGNVPIERPSVFDRIDLRGELPLGYEVELYRNDVLIGSVDRPLEGRYEFREVPLEYGLNILRLVFYGARGERREEIRRLNAGEGRLGRGEFQFSAGAVQQDRPLIDLGESRGAGSVGRLGEGEWRAAAYAEFGLTSALTMAGGLTTFSIGEGRRHQALLGLRTGVADAAVQADAAWQSGGGLALQAGVAGRAFGASYLLQHAEYRGGFLDETRGGSSGAFERATQVRADASIKLGSRTIAANLVAERAEGDGRTEWSAALRASTNIGRWLASHLLEARQFGSTERVNRTITGALEANGAVRGWGARAGLGYELEPRLALRDVSLTFDRELRDAMLLRVGLTQQLNAERDTRAALSISKRFRQFELSGDVQYDTGSGGLLVGMRVGFSLGRGRRGLALAAPGFARGGSLRALAFRDTDGDGLRDPGEAAVEGIAFRGGAAQARTNGRGEALVAGLGDGRPTTVEIVGETLDDPYLSPTRNGVEIVPRPGRTHVADFPIVAVSEIEGEARFQSDGAARAVSNVQLQLVDERGAVAASARTEYDGFFLFERVAPGRYRIRLDPEQARTLKVRLVEEPVAVATAEGGLVGKIALTLTRDADAPGAK